MKKIQKIVLSSSFAALLLPAAETLAQTTNAPEASVGIEEVLVTGRKREESLTDVPVSISVFNATALLEQGINTQDDLFAATVGLDYGNFSGTRDGNNPGVRGVQSDLRASNQQKVASFVDGMPMLGNQGTLQFSGIEAVEVYRGPQSAAFGRSTFAGAINYVTADSSEEFEAKVMVDASDLGGREFGALISGPITDNLGYRISYVENDWDGPDDWTATDGTMLGSEQTEYLNAKFNFEFTDTVYGELSFSKLNTFDQGGAQWITDLASCGAESDVNLTGMGADVFLPAGVWDCDTDIPSTGIARNADVLGQFLGQFDANEAFYRDSLGMGFGALDTDSNGVLSSSEYLAQTFADGQSYEQALLGQSIGDNVGTEKENTRIQGELNFEIGDGLLQFLAMSVEDTSFAWNENDSNGAVAAFSVNMMTGQTALSANIMSMLVPIDIEESYAEVRWVSPDSERLRYTLSGSYYDYSLQQQVYNNGGALFYDLIVDNPASGNDGLPVDPAAGITISEVATNIGVSFGAQYDLTDRTTLSFEARYQVDDVCGTGFNIGGAGLNVERCQETKAILPRIAINTNLNDTTSVYGQISLGNNPAGVNIAYADPRNIQALLIASGQIAVPDFADNGIDVPVNAGVIYNGEGGNPDPVVSYDASTFPDFEEEELLNYELGIKGSFAGRRGAYTAAVYFMDYKGIIGAENLNWDDTTEAGGAIVTGGWNEGSWSDFGGERTWINQGDGEMYGIELTTDYAIDDIWTVGGYATLSTAKYTDFCSFDATDYEQGGPGGASIIPILTPAADGVPADCGVVDGNWIPRQAGVTANVNVSASLPNDLFGMRTSLRADVRHKGSFYEDHLNLLERDAVTTVNVSANMRSDNVVLRFYVNNLTDNQEPARVSLANDYVTGADPSVAPVAQSSWGISPTRPREAGFQVQYAF